VLSTRGAISYWDKEDTTKSDRYSGAIAIGVGLLIVTYVSPFFTEAAINSGFALPRGANCISSLVDGVVPTTAIFVRAFKIGYFGLALVGIIALVTAYMLRRKDKRLTVEFEYIHQN
jgi:PTS system galactitol-specific IIC component